MTKLTEEMVIARTRISDLTQVKKLNFWGGDLSDVGLLKNMPNVEILALSVNNISTLADIQHCKKLQELYIRKNNIVDLKEICYLKDLPHLKNLWLADNPCAETDGYRLSVLRTIPQLQKLDDVPVQAEELKEAMKKGKELTLPLDDEEPERIAPPRKKESVQELNNNRMIERDTPVNQVRQADKERSASPARNQSSKVAPSRRTSAVEEAASRRTSTADEPAPAPLRRSSQNQGPAGIATQPSSRKHSSQVSEEISSWRRSVAELHPEIREEDPPVVTRPQPNVAPPEAHPAHLERNSEPYGYDRYQHADPRGCPVHNMASSRPQSRQQPVAELFHPDQFHHAPQPQPMPLQRPVSMDPPYHQRSPAYGAHGMDQDSLNGRYGEPVDLTAAYGSFSSRGSRQSNRASWTEGTHFQPHPGPVENGHVAYERTFRSPYPQPMGPGAPLPNEASPHAPRISPSRHYAQRSRSRTSNLLTAALCLVKELDIGSLEVLEMAVRSRMEELDD